MYAWTVEHVGITTPLLEHPEMVLPHMRGRVLPAVRDALVRMNATFHIDQLYIRPKLRVDDIAIMDIVMRRERKPLVVRKINAVHEWIGTFYLSEIVQLNGEKLQSSITQHEALTEYEITRRRVKQTKPDRTCWRLFLDAIMEVCDQHGYLNSPLGKWTSDHSGSGRWKFYLENSKVYELSLIHI